MDAESQDELLRGAKTDMQNQLPLREEIIAARCFIAHQLGQSLGEEQVRQPLSLVNSAVEVSNSSELEGLQEQYVESVKRNLLVRMKFVEAQEEHRKTRASQEEEKKVESRILDLHMEVMRLQQKYDKQRVVIKYLEQLQQLPAASVDFLDPEVMYKDCSPLPEIPKEMVEIFATDPSSTDAEVGDLLQRLKKSVLRGKLVAKRDKQRLERARVRDPIDQNDLEPEAKLHALNVVKNTLITWIESQLGNAGDADGDHLEESSPEQESAQKVDIETRLADIQIDYRRHVELRKEILGLVARRDSLRLRQSDEPKKEPTTEDIRTSEPPPYAYLLIPYLEQLQTLSHEQKSLIQEKSHINNTLSKQSEDTRQTLGHLVQESQLLPKYPATKTSKSQPSFEEATQTGGRPGVVKQVQPWIYAADSAKIRTLEIVAEKLEEGMMSIDESRQAIEKACKLLNVELPGAKSDLEQEDTEKDLWLSEVNDEKSRLTTRNEKEKKEAPEPPTNIWSILDGNLGSINE